jgi:NADH:ubiquinone oxidoreductase subunit D
MARCTGLKRDIRINILTTYAYYFYLNFKSFTAKNGDSYDRYLLRISEIIESLQIINITINKLNFNNDYIRTNKKKKPFKTMEDVIKHFKY